MLARFYHHRITQIIKRQSMRQHSLLKITTGLVITGATFAIALTPAQAQTDGTRARQSEGRQYVTAMLRSQAAFYLENTKFSGNFQELGNPIKASTSSYRYKIAQPGSDFVQINAIPQIKGLKAYIGFIISETADHKNMRTLLMLCASNGSDSYIPRLSSSSRNMQCASGYTSTSLY
jgi:type IV pilus assembly protein PilA